MAVDGRLLADALELLVGEEQTWIVGGDTPEWREVLADYSNVQIADALEVPEGTRDTARWTARRSFFRSLQRYRNFANDRPRERRSPTAAAQRRLVDAGIILREREATPPDLGSVLRLVRRHGLTIAYTAGWLQVSEDISYRTIEDVFCGPGALGAEGFHGAAELARESDIDDAWREAFEALLIVHLQEYGIGGGRWLEVDELALQIGHQARASVGGHRVAGPHRVAS